MKMKTMTRRQYLRVTALGLLALPAARAGAAQVKASHATVRYQDHPNHGQHCAICAHYIAARGEQAPACALVQRPILTNGWCILFLPKT